MRADTAPGGGVADHQIIEPAVGDKIEIRQQLPRGGQKLFEALQ